MQSQQPWRLISSGALMALGCLITVIMARAQYHSFLFWLAVILFLAGLVWMVLEVVRIRQNALRYVARMNAALTRTLQTAPDEMPVPMAVVDVKGEIIWYNAEFTNRVSGGAELFGLKLHTVIPLRPDAIGDGESIETVIRDRRYRVSRADYERKNGHAILFCFEDITNYVQLRQHYMDTRPCVLMILVDNYEDLFSGTRQSERAAALASLEALFDRMLEGTESVFCHMDDDRMLIVTEARHCLEMERAHFPLLDEARKIKVRGRSSLTLSIGVGRSGETLAQNEFFAQQSLDMALGRGGDQAAVKTDSGFTFYGGVSQGIEHKSKAKNRAIAKDLLKLMLRCTHVYIMGHRASDLDAVGAAVGVAYIAEQCEIPYNIVIRTESTMARLLTDRIEEELPGCMIPPEEARDQIRPDDLLVIVDTFSKDIVEDAELYRMASHVVVIDHHRQMVNYLDNTTLKLHDPHASSAAELVTGMIQYFDFRDEMPQFCAEALMAGIMLDTKNFVMQTGVHTFEVAAFLRDRGADPIAVKTLFAESLEAYQQRSRLVSEAKLFGRYAIATAADPVKDIRVIASQAADELLGVEGVDASFVLYTVGDQACISARSLGRVNVQVIMEQLGGGGHQIMAATQRTDCSLIQLCEKLVAVLKQTDAEAAQPEEDPEEEPEGYPEDYPEE
ncbi:MAG: DHH family phosphoesterase [Oscillospiraceae bacterium]|nr:DHH family phosphoesterase [Oscillospiraceae bacterium]